MVNYLAPCFLFVPKIIEIVLFLNVKCLKHCTDCSFQGSQFLLRGTGFNFHVVVAKILVIGLQS